MFSGFNQRQMDFTRGADFPTQTQIEGLRYFSLRSKPQPVGSLYSIETDTLSRGTYALSAMPHHRYSMMWRYLIVTAIAYVVSPSQWVFIL